jgi:signal transduction histidine kinase
VRLADFIEGNLDTILAEWVAFAESCGTPGATMNVTGLRDHAVAMLKDVVVDLRTPQTAKEQVEKSKGNAAAPAAGDADTAAEVHGAGRAESGFTVAEMVSEYRALRASVIRLWTKASGSLTGDDLQDLMRFNEAIDQSLSESVSRFTDDVDYSREMFLAILGHDLRSPLNVVTMASQFMLETGDLHEPNTTLVARIARSSKHMNGMVGDLLDFTRSRLGSSIPISRQRMDLAKEAGNIAEDIQAAHKGTVIDVKTSGDLVGEWDCPRIGQVLTNLLGNAIQHGAPQSTVRVTIRGQSDHATMEIHNWGPAIPDADMKDLFSPFKRLKTGEKAAAPTSSLGLGLYIAERIVSAHGGTLAVTSSESAGTLFSVRLPRSNAA